MHVYDHTIVSMGTLPYKRAEEKTQQSLKVDQQ